MRRLVFRVSSATLPTFLCAHARADAPQEHAHGATQEHAHAATPPTNADSPRLAAAAPFHWRPAAAFTPAELDASTTSCFVLLVYAPRAGAGLAPGRAARGHAFRLGPASSGDVTHWRALRSTVPRVVLVAHERGGLELPGGKRDAGETLVDAATRELAEEVGAALDPPLSWDDACLVRVADGGAHAAPRWLLFARVLRDEAQLNSILAGLPLAKGYPGEILGAVGAPLFVEGARGQRGFARVLGAMPPWQAQMLLPALVAARILEGSEAQELARAADAFVEGGGHRRRRQGEVDISLEGAIDAALPLLKGAGAGGAPLSPPRRLGNDVAPLAPSPHHGSLARALPPPLERPSRLLE